MTIGAGTDIVSVPRVARLIADHGARFVRALVHRRGDRLLQRQGAAEPALRGPAGGQGGRLQVAQPGRGARPIPWRSIEIGHDPLGVPDVRLSGSLLEGADRAGIGRIRVSLSHCAEFATAVAIADEAG